MTSFDLSDLSLMRNGQPLVLSVSQSLTTADNITWTLGGLITLTKLSGDYVLTLADGSVSDLVGNYLVAGASDAWTSTASTVVVEGSEFLYETKPHRLAIHFLGDV